MESHSSMEKESANSQYRVLLLTGESEKRNPIQEFLEADSDVKLSVRTQKFKAEEVAGKFDIAVSYGYRHILRQSHIDQFERIVNMHIAYLPWNRGADPNLLLPKF